MTLQRTFIALVATALVLGMVGQLSAAQGEELWA